MSGLSSKKVAIKDENLNRYFFENSKGNKLTVKQKLYRDISYELKTNNGVETTVYRDGFIAI